MMLPCVVLRYIMRGVAMCSYALFHNIVRFKGLPHRRDSHQKMPGMLHNSRGFKGDHAT